MYEKQPKRFAWLQADEENIALYEPYRHLYPGRAIAGFGQRVFPATVHPALQ